MDKFQRAIQYLVQTMDSQVFDKLKGIVLESNLQEIEELKAISHTLILQTIESVQSKKKWEEYGRLY